MLIGPKMTTKEVAFMADQIHLAANPRIIRCDMDAMSQNISRPIFMVNAFMPL